MGTALRFTVAIILPQSRREVNCDLHVLAGAAITGSAAFSASFAFAIVSWETPAIFATSFFVSIGAEPLSDF